MIPSTHPAREKHTPLPWETEGAHVTANGAFVANTCWSNTKGPDENDLANAQFIVTACNSHAALISALEKAVAAAEYVVRIVEANDQAGTSASAFKKADYVATLAHAYGAMAFVTDARKALNLAKHED